MLPLVITVEDRTGHKKRFAFADSPVRLGRSPLADLQLTEAFISRWEGTLRFDDKSITYFNLNSTNPTYVDGREVAANEEIEVGVTSQLTVGELTLRFNRENVPEADLRRKGKRRPVSEGEEVSVKTVWLGALGPVSPAPLKETEKRQQRQAVVGRAEGEAQKPEAERPATTAVTAEARSPAQVPPRSRETIPYEPQRPLSVPPPAEKAVLPGTEFGGAAGLGQEPNAPSVAKAQPVVVGAPDPAPGNVRSASVAPRQVEPASSAEATASRTKTFSEPPESQQPASLDALHTSYRAAFGRLLAQLTNDLESAPESERAQLADQQQRKYPQITQEPEYRALLRRMNFEPRKADIAEISDWLRGISEGLLPPKIRLDTGLTLVRILALLEMLTQSFAEINDAQDQICRKWLGRPPRRSLLHSDNGRVILAYLLNPKADWNERVGELEEGIREVVMHDLALFKATLEGAKTLLEALSPAALASAEGIPLESSEENTGGSFWGRLKQRGEPPEIRLWRRFISTYEGLQDGGRYQRVFLGRPFARTYLAAMGQSDLRATGQTGSPSSSSEPTGGPQ